MQSWSDLTEVPADLGRCVVAIGVFDGVHMGHRVLISRAVGAARQAGVPAVLLTFEPHPAEVVRPEAAPLRLTSAADKEALVAELDIDAMLVLAFTPELSHLEPDEFIRLVLIAFVIAAPLAWYLAHEWLKGFEYKIEPSIAIFVIAGAGSLAIALITVSYESVRAATVNPIKSLRNE